MKQKRLKPEARKEDILAAALKLAEKHGYMRVTREMIAKAAQVSGPTLHYHFGTVAQLRRDIMRYAIQKRSLAVVAQGISAKDGQAMKADDALRRQAIESLL